MKYPYLLFDADDTLFDYPKASLNAFSRMCQANDIPDTPANYQLYFTISEELWHALDRGEVTKEFLVVERYVRFLKAINLHRDPVQCNQSFLTALGSKVFPIPHAEEVCRELCARGHKLYIATNAVASVHRSRMKSSGFDRWFLDDFISEEAGASKPTPGYFHYIFQSIPDLSPENTLMIGDSLSSDIQGANNAGLPCCWFNPAKLPRPADLRIDYEINDLKELLYIV